MTRPVGTGASRPPANPPMNILLVNTLYQPNVLGGAERSVQLLAEGLTSTNHRVSVASCSTGEQPDSRAQVNGVTVHYLRTRNVYSSPTGGTRSLMKPLWHVVDTFNPFMAAQLGKLLDHHRPDLVHTNTVGGFSVAAWQAAARRAIPIVHTLRDFYLICPRTTMFRGESSCAEPCLECKIYNWPRRLMSSRVRALVSISEFLLKTHLGRNYFTNATVRAVIRNATGVSHAASQPGSAPPAGKLVLGYLGRLDPSKGVASFLDAARQLPPDRFEILIAGKGEPAYQSSLVERYAADNIRFLGFVDPQELFSRIHLLVVPSLWNEPLGRVVLEAHSCHVPVVVSRRGGLPELVDEGRTGLLYEPDRPGELLDILKGLTPAVCEIMRNHCVGKASEFAPERIASEYAKVYEQAIAGVVKTVTR